MKPARGQILRILVNSAILFGIALPILLGMWETLLPAFGILPAIGTETATLEPWRILLSEPGFFTSLRLTLFTGLVSTTIALLTALSLCIVTFERVPAHKLGRFLLPLLAMPHAAMAIGLAFLISPSGWLARTVSPWPTGWLVPPDIATVHDSWGLTLILGLLLKEVPFFLFVLFAALHQLPVSAHIKTAQSLGYSTAHAWIKVILPQVYPLIRLPTYVALAFSLSVIDVSLILGPGNPPTLAVLTLRWFNSPDVNKLPPAAAAATLQIVVVLAGIAMLRLAELILGFLGRLWLERGGRGLPLSPGITLAASLAAICLGAGLGAFAVLSLWSIAGGWQFPDAWPAHLTYDNWVRSTQSWLPATLNTLALALLSGLLSLALAIGWLESEDRTGVRRTPLLLFAVYLPLVVPQVAFLFGLHMFLLKADLNGTFAILVWGHSLFVFPYIMIALADPWRALDRRYSQIAATLGRSPAAVLFRVKMPLLLRPVLAAFALAIAVSVAQYLPTLVLGEGRFVSLTTEAVSLSSGADRRIAAVHAVLQTIIPLAGFGFALLLPTLLYRSSVQPERQEH